MVMDGGDDKERIDLLTSLVLANDIREEEERIMSNTTMNAATETLSVKRKIAHETSSSSSYFKRRRHVVSQEPNRAEPITEIKLNHHDASSRMSDEPMRAQPIREIKPVRRRNRPLIREPGETPGWLVDLMRKKNGADAKLIIEKKITASDLRESQARLSMPINQMAEMHFLNEAEVNILKEDQGRARKKGVDVILVDADGKDWGLNLRIWDMNSSSNFVLCSGIGWKKVVDHHKLEEGQIIRLWSFRSQDGMLYIAIPLKLPAPTRDSDNLGQSILESIPVPQVCMETAPLKAVQETDTRISLVPVTEETSQESDTELDLELRLYWRDVQETDTRISLVPVTETSQESDTELDLELRL